MSENLILCVKTYYFIIFIKLYLAILIVFQLGVRMKIFIFLKKKFDLKFFNYA